MKESPRARRLRRHHRRTKNQGKLNLVSLMDIFTILVFFLMVNSSDVKVMQNTADVPLPTSAAKQEAVENLTVQVVGQSILVQGREVARLDGIEAAQFDPLQLRQSVAYVPETPEFLPLSIEDNLRLMNPVASDVDIQDACTLAGVMEDIRVMETGIGANRRFGLAVDMTPFTRDPHPGFLKRLALARGYLRQSGLLLLDGPERHLDPAGEQALLAAIEQLRGETTVIVATDRPQIIRLADRVLWLDGGRTRGAGPSAQVLQQLYDEGRVGQTLTEQ